jgi:hypothetical protein
LRSPANISRDWSLDDCLVSAADTTSQRNASGKAFSRRLEV